MKKLIIFTFLLFFTAHFTHAQDSYRMYLDVSPTHFSNWKSNSESYSLETVKRLPKGLKIGARNELFNYYVGIHKGENFYNNYYYICYVDLYMPTDSRQLYPDIDISAGIQYNFLRFNNFSSFIGIEFLYNIISYNRFEFKRDDLLRTITSLQSSKIGFGPLLGIEYRFNPILSIVLDSRFTFEYLLDPKDSYLFTPENRWVHKWNAINNITLRFTMAE